MLGFRQALSMNNFLILLLILAPSLLSAQTEDPLDVEYKKLKSFIKQTAEWIAAK